MSTSPVNPVLDSELAGIAEQMGNLTLTNSMPLDSTYMIFDQLDNCNNWFILKLALLESQAAELPISVEYGEGGEVVGAHVPNEITNQVFQWCLDHKIEDVCEMVEDLFFPMPTQPYRECCWWLCQKEGDWITDFNRQETWEAKIDFVLVGVYDFAFRYCPEYTLDWRRRTDVDTGKPHNSPVDFIRRWGTTGTVKKLEDAQRWVPAYQEFYKREAKRDRKVAPSYGKTGTFRRRIKAGRVSKPVDRRQTTKRPRQRLRYQTSSTQRAVNCLPV
ncbi:hypothetical protein GGR57DRAFT_512006 [Xylariaceae sp. FL1272]|nr:hypothetical protein GGR57DRAFT_512006 [Xylariaceae sp. FL1272]